jgi:TonB family protein
LLFEAANQLRFTPFKADPQMQRLLQPRVEFGQRLLARAQQYGYSMAGVLARLQNELRTNSPATSERPANLAPAPPAPLPPATVQEPMPPTPSRIRVGSNVQNAMLTQKVDPVYPEQALTAGPDGGALVGTVTLSVVIGNDGRVQSVEPTSGHPLLATAAEEAVRQWIYKPTLLNGNPVEVSTSVDVPFTAK